MALPIALPSPFELRPLEHIEPLRVSALAGREEVSRPFRFGLAVTAPHGDLTLARSLLRARATLMFHEGADVPRRIHGLIAKVSLGAVQEGDHRRLDLTLVPRLWQLGRRRARRIFQDRTTVAIAEAILAEWGLPLRSLVQRELPRRAYCVQYDETDLAFLSRLFAEDGLFYGFDHPEAASEGDVLLLADRPGDAAPIDGDPRLVLRSGAAGAGSLADEAAITTATPELRARSRRARVRGHDFRRPQAPLDDETAAEPAPLDTLDEHEGSYEDDLGLRPARIRLEQERAPALGVSAETFCKRLAPVRRFSFDDDGASGLRGDFIVTRVDHEGYSGDTIPAGRARYQNRVRFIPADVAPRPRWSPPRPRQVAEIATVVGPPGAEIHSDEHGRIKVQFHWDREGAGDDRSSCWLRVATPWAGTGWGVQFLPRVGMEVLVTFLGGDIDRPVCAGALHNATHLVPFPFATDPARSGIRTSSTPGGHGHHEISFNDRAGAEQLFVRAQRDYDEVVGRNRASRVAGSRTDEVGGARAERVTGDASASIGGDREAEIAGGERATVGKDRSVTVRGDDALDVGGGARTLIKGNASVEVRGRSTFLVGTDEAPTHREEYVFGSASIASKDQLVLRSESKLLLQCGDAVIELSPDRIVLSAPTIELAAAKSLTCKAKDGPTVALGDEVEVLSKKVRIFTEAAALELDRQVKIDGEKIKLGYDPKKPELEAGAAAPETRTFQCRLTDYYLEPYARRKYHLIAEGLRFEGETDADGCVKADIPEAARSVAIRLWLDAYPEGRQRLYTFRLGDLPPPTEVRGAKIRLRNLGYYTGPLDDELDDDFRAAVADFQGDHRETHDLAPTGELDEGTTGALEEVHGH